MKILVADDHAILRKGLIQILKKEFLNVTFFEASNGAEALKILLKNKLDIALIDISMPKLNGIEVLKQAKSSEISTPILILSMQPEEQYAIRVLKAGASGFLNKNSSTELLVNVINKVLSGKRYVSPKIADQLLNAIGDNQVENLYENLSDRELEVLQLIAHGKTVTEIAAEASISVNTVSTYRSRILQKLGLKNNAALIRYVIHNKLDLL